AQSIGLSDSIRWRAVHALGVFTDYESAKLLLQALDADRYEWCRYGAARSLVECAARSTNQDKTDEGNNLRIWIVGNLTARAPKLSSGDLGSKRVLDEIGRALFYRDAAPGWAEEAAKLLNAICQCQSDVSTVAVWAERRKKFHAWSSKEGSAAK